MFLAKTWLEEARLGSIRDSLQFSHYHDVSRITCGGGLAIFWKNGFNLEVESSSQNHIDVVINKGKDNAWRFTGIYEAPKTHLHSETWELIRGLHRRVSLPWLCGGDFNEILKSHEKSGGRLRPYGQIEQFREVRTSVIYSILASPEINSLGLELLWWYGLGEVRSGSKLGGMV